MLVWGGLTAATAQDSARGILGLGNAVVTGFSGVRPPAAPLPPRIDPIEKTFIDLDRPSARGINLDALRGPPRAQVVQAPKPFSVTAAQVGQVFAIALDDATPPNLYLAATSAYGLPIVVPDRDGDRRPDRSRRGGPNASFMPGLFGPVTVDGGPGSIWKIDGRTGVVTLFANVMLDRAPNSGPALGGLAFDPATRQLFVADRDTGMIHRFGLDGADRGRFDHGADALPAAGVPPVRFDPRKRLDPTSPAFDSGNPATWAYAPPTRRVFGLAVRGGRLFYAVAAGLQVWSVSIAQDGRFGSDPRLELNVPRGQSIAEVSNIVFDEDGRMILAERGAPTGAYDYKALAEAGENRVLRFRPKRPGDPPSPGLWHPVAEEYAVGFPPDFRNDNGGLAIGYGYDASGSINRTACGGTLWSSGEQLRNARDRAIIQRLQPGGPLIVDGLQGNAIRLVRPQNEPPFESYSVDYDDRFVDAGARGHLGDVEIWRVCGQAAVPPPLLPVVPALACPPGWFNVAGACLSGLACPRGTEFADGRCVYRDCPPSYVNVRGKCVPPPVICKSGETYVDGRCELPTCPPGLVVAKPKNGLKRILSPAPVAPAQDEKNGSQTVIIPPANGVNGTNGRAGVYCECPTGTEPGKDGTCVATPPAPPAPGECQEGATQVCRGVAPNIICECYTPPPAPGSCPDGTIEVCSAPGVCGCTPLPTTSPPVRGGCTVQEILSGNCLTPPPARGLPAPACPTGTNRACLGSVCGCVGPPTEGFCQGGPFKLVDGTCCLGHNYSCTAKPADGTCPSGTEHDLGPPWSSTPVCCRSLSADAAGTCGAPPTPSPTSPAPTTPKAECLLWLLVPVVGIVPALICVSDLAEQCQADTDCAAGTTCKDGECVDQVLQPSAAPATGTCQPPSIQVGGACCTPEAVAAGTCGVQPPPAAGACKAGLYPSNDGKTCCTKEEITRETCGSPPPAAPKKAQKAKTTTKPKTKKQEIVCQKGFHVEGGRCVRDSQPQASPGLTIQFGIGIGGGGGGRPGGGGARPGHGTPN